MTAPDYDDYLALRIENDFKYHPSATPETGGRHDVVRSILGSVAQNLAVNLPAGRERALVLTKLEEAMFWAHAAIARSSTDEEAPE